MCYTQTSNLLICTCGHECCIYARLIHVDIYHEAHHWSISHFHVHCRSFCTMGLSPALLPASSHSFSLA